MKLRLCVAVLVLLVLSSGVGAAQSGSGEVVGSPDIEVVVPENDITPGEENEVEIYLLNEGYVRSSGPSEFVERVTTARGTTVSLRSRSDDIEVVTETVVVGSLPTGEKGPYTVRLDVDEDIREGRHSLSAEVEYAYTRIVEYGESERLRDLKRTERQDVNVEVRRDARFRVVEASTDARVGEKGTLSLTLRNHGSVEAHDAVVEARARGKTISFEDGASFAEGFVGNVATGESVRVELPVRFSSDANSREQPIGVNVRYEDEAGVSRESRTLSPSVSPHDEQSFEVRNVTSTLTPGTAGTLSAELINPADEAVGDVTLNFVGNDTSTDILDKGIALGSVGPSETVDFSARIEVAPGVSSDRQVVIVPEYSRNGEEYVADRLRLRVPVGEHRDRFGVRSLDTGPAKGETSTVRFEFKNQDEAPVRNVTVVAISEEPVEIDDDKAYLGTLESDETATVGFDIDAESDATARTHPVRFSFEYTDSAGERRNATAVAPVEIVGDDAPVPFENIILSAVVVFLLAALGWWVYGKEFVERRRK